MPCFLEALKYLKTSKQHPFETPGTHFHFLEMRKVMTDPLLGPPNIPLNYDEPRAEWPDELGDLFFLSFFLNLYRPGGSKGCFLEAFKYLKAFLSLGVLLFACMCLVLLVFLMFLGLGSKELTGLLNTSAFLPRAAWVQSRSRLRTVGSD